jgi:hypothetical protein
MLWTDIVEVSTTERVTVGVRPCPRSFYTTPAADRPDDA